MKTTELNLLSLLILTLILSCSNCSAVGSFTSNSRLSMELGTNGNLARLTISNANNQVWVVESSTDLANWSAFATWKIHNGSFHTNVSGNAAAPSRFFRAVYDPNLQDIGNTTVNSLLLPSSSFNYAAPVLPLSFSVNPILGQDNTPLSNITTDSGATLGRVLFYDKRLSTNRTISCASCHQQEYGFSDPRPFSTGFDGGLTARNSMSLSHARWYQRRNFFWDERAATLEDQVLMPIQNMVEMGMTLEALTNRLASEPYYTNLFAIAFGTPAVTTNRISRALAQFVRSIVSVQSKYDLGASNHFANFTPQENLGRQIFFGQVGNPPATCAACHGTENFVPGPALNNNGLEFPYMDKGVGAITGNTNDDGKFKVPSLRNIALTAPYMHDGRFTNLEQVVEFYNSGVVDNPNLSAPLRLPPPPGQTVGPVRRLNLTQQQKDSLVAFLRTLTDPNLATDPKYSDPFNYGE
ncbi:MAG: cytochrome-c peroxidase [Verrucomicrobiota bacterium]